MLVRDAEGRIIIISRKDFLSEKAYFQRLYEIKLTHINNSKSIMSFP